jgi:hypothetical protein
MIGVRSVNAGSLGRLSIRFDPVRTDAFISPDWMCGVTVRRRPGATGNAIAATVWRIYVNVRTFADLRDGIGKGAARFVHVPDGGSNAVSVIDIAR